MISALSLLLASSATNLLAQGGSAELPTSRLPWEGLTKVESAGHRYITRGGNLVGEAFFDKWSDLPNLPIVEEGKISWKVKVLVLGLVERVQSGPIPTSRFLDIPMAADEVLRNELRAFTEMVKRGSGGRVRVSVQYELNREVVVDRDGGRTLGTELLQGRLGAGEVNSVLVIHPEAIRTVASDFVNGTPVSRIPYWAITDSTHPGVAATWLYSAWLDQVLMTMQSAGYATEPYLMDRLASARAGDCAPPPLLSSLVSEPMWQVLSTGAPYDSSKLPATEGNWDQFRLDPFRLPLAKAAGSVAFGNSLTFGFPASTAVRPEAVSFVAGQTGIAPSGYDWDNRAFLFPTTRILDAPVTSPPALPMSQAFESGAAEKLESAGSIGFISTTDNDRGAVGKWMENYPARNAKATIFGFGPEGVTSPILSENVVLSFWIRPVGKARPIDIVAQGLNGERRYRLYQGFVPVTEPGVQVVEMKPGSGWQEVILRIGDLPGGKLYSLGVESPPECFGMKEYIGNWVTYFFDDWKLALDAAAKPSPIITPKLPLPNSRSGAADERLAFVLSVLNGPQPPSEENVNLVRGLLADDIDDVRHAAAMLFTKVKVPNAHNDLEPIATGLSPRGSEIGIQALQFQDTEPSWVILRRIAERGPFDYQKGPAIAAWMQGQPKTLKPYLLANQIVVRSWETRANAAALLFGMNDKVATTVAASFLNEAEPAALARFLPKISTADPTGITRLKEIAKTSPSEKVRGIAVAVLGRSAKFDVADYGELTRVGKVGFLETLRATDTWAEPQLTELLTSKDISVKVAAIASPLNKNRMAPNDDRDPRFLLGLAAVLTPWPEWLSEAIKTSPDPKVRNLAPKLPLN